MDRRSLFAVSFGFVAALSLWLVVYLQSPVVGGGFGVVLTHDYTVVVTDADVEYYNITSHELTLTSECAERLKGMKGYLEGNFTIVVNGEEELSGIFVPPIISRSYPSSQVVIVYPAFDMSYGVMRIQMGYPWGEPVGQDPRDNPKIAQYFKGTGRLAR